MLEYPQRSPLIVADAMQDLIQGKVVCDVGCGEGDLMRQFTRYAREVIGIESNNDRLQVAIKAGLDARGGDVQIRVPEADVYYIWMGRRFMHDATPHCMKGIIVYGRSDDTEPDFIPYKIPIHEIRDVPFKEGNYKGYFHLSIHYPE